MSTPRSTEEDSSRQGFALGLSMLAAVLLLIAGIVSLLQGIAAAAGDDLFVVGVNYTYSFNLTGWGWVHIIIGILVIIASFGLFAGATWARVVAITLASLSIIANFLWLPNYPLWAIVVIVLDVIVIWAVATWNPDRY